MELGKICRDDGRTVVLTDEAAIHTTRPIVTCNEHMTERLALLESVAATDLPVLISGESGTCKEDYAEYIHCCSSRAEAPYVCFDCAATHESQYEERLFGAVHPVGETIQVRRGLVEATDGGTVVLNRVSEVPPVFYRRLLRLLDERTIVRRGAREKTAVNVRLLATCSEDVMGALARDPQMARLLQRLSAVRVDVLPLRQRREDIALLALHDLAQANERYSMHKRMGSALFREILAYDWPGNERELRSFVEQMALVSRGDVLDDPTLIRSTGRLSASLIPAWKRANAEAESRTPSLKEQVRAYELMIIRQSIAKYGSLRKAAAALKVDPSVLSRKLSAGKE